LLRRNGDGSPDDLSGLFGSHVSRAARIEPVTVPSCACASEQFAACLTVEAADEFACEYLGVHELAKGYDRCPLYRVLRR
jgi:class 3 adenylate cyclase